MIFKTESGRVGYRMKYRVSGRVRVPAGHWSREFEWSEPLPCAPESTRVLGNTMKVIHPMKTAIQDYFWQKSVCVKSKTLCSVFNSRWKPSKMVFLSNTTMSNMTSLCLSLTGYITFYHLHDDMYDLITFTYISQNCYTQKRQESVTGIAWRDWWMSIMWSK